MQVAILWVWHSGQRWAFCTDMAFCTEMWHSVQRHGILCRDLRKVFMTHWAQQHPATSQQPSKKWDRPPGWYCYMNICWGVWGPCKGKQGLWHPLPLAAVRLGVQLRHRHTNVHTQTWHICTYWNRHTHTSRHRLTECFFVETGQIVPEPSPSAKPKLPHRPSCHHLHKWAEPPHW